MGSELNIVLDDYELVDHRYVGPVFTWSNSHVYCKLDRVMVNRSWLNMLHESTVQFLPPGVSDHACSVLRVFKEDNKRGFLFRLKNIWTTDASFLPLVEQAWNTRFYGCLMYQVVAKLRVLKQELKQLNSRRFQHLEKRVDAKLSEMKDLQFHILEHPDRRDLVEDLKAVTAD